VFSLFSDIQLVITTQFTENCEFLKRQFPQRISKCLNVAKRMHTVPKAQRIMV